MVIFLKLIIEDDGDYGDAKFEISGSDDELSEDADF